MYVVENVLMTQSVHTDEACAENEPVLHALHVIGLDAPCTADSVPAGQSTHAWPSFE
jgi:hypothetical protein